MKFPPVTAATITGLLAAGAAVLAYLPYGWAHLAAGSIAAGLAASHGGAALYVAGATSATTKANTPADAPKNTPTP